MKISGFFTLGKVLIAAIAICAFSSPAKADLELTFTPLGGTPVTITNASGTVNVGGYSVTYAVSETPTGSSDTLSATLVAVNTSGTAAGFTYTLTETAASTPPKTATLINTLTDIAGGTASVGGVQATYLDSTIGPKQTGVLSSSGSDQVSLGGAANYRFTTTGSVYGGAVGNVVVLSSSAQVIGVPEPTGVIAALAGLPCMGLVVGFARRRRAVEPAAM